MKARLAVIATLALGICTAAVTAKPWAAAVIVSLFTIAAAPNYIRAQHSPYAKYGMDYSQVADLITEIEGSPFSEGSRFVHGTVSTYTSELAHRWRRAGLVVLGKTNTPEFGMVPACEPTLFGATANPWDVNRSTSGCGAQVFCLQFIRACGSARARTQCCFSRTRRGSRRNVAVPC